MNKLNIIFPVKKVDDICMTEQQKIEDFEYIYSNICNSMPMIKQYYDEWELDFEGNKEKYADMIRLTSNDYEFYCTIHAIIQDIPSFHTDIVNPGLESYQKLNCFNLKNIITDRTSQGYWKYWEEIANKGVTALEQKEYYVMLYNDGKYMLYGMGDYEETEINSINGINVDEFIKDNTSSYQLLYDGKNNKLYRNKVIFNTMEGEEVQIKTSFNEKKLCYSIVQEMNYGIIYKDANKQWDSTEEEMSDYYETDSYTYIRIDNFESNGDDVKSKIENSSKDTVVLDLRNNTGGKTDFAAKYIYAPLFTRDIKETHTWYMPDTEQNRKMYDSIISYFMFGKKKASQKQTFFKNNKDYFEYTITKNYKGNAKCDKNVIVLISRKTGSAADEFASLIKEHKLGVLVGNNTGGEGLIKTYMADELPNSHLVYIYEPGCALNPDGSDNSLYGTSPDYYITDVKQFLENISNL